MTELKETSNIQCTKCENQFHRACEDVPKASAMDDTIYGEVLQDNASNNLILVH